MLKEEKTVGQLAVEYGVHSNTLYRARYHLHGAPQAHRRHEEVYLKEYANPREARKGLTDYLHFYNEERVHQSLDYRTPADVYLGK